MENWIQFDLKPTPEPAGFYRLIIYIDGQCFSAYMPSGEVHSMVRAGIVEQTRMVTQGKNGELITKPYPNKVDGAGVQYTSDVFETKKRAS